jgi:hypothetical protein
MLPMAVWQSAHILACGYDLPAALTDLARRMCLVAFRIKVVDLAVLAFVVLDLTLGHTLGPLRLPEAPGLLPEEFFAAILGRQAHRASLAVRDRRLFRLHLTV